MENKQDLAEFVRAVMNEKELSTYDVQKASGNKITAATVTKIVNGEIKKSGVATLEALAKGLGEPPEDVIRIARGLSPQDATNRFEIYAERFDAHDVSESEWQYLELFFKDQVDRFRNEKIQHRRMIEQQDDGFGRSTARPANTKLAPVVARIEPGIKQPSRTINDEEIAEAEKRTTPKKKAI